MEVEDMKVIKEDERGIIYDCDKMKCIIRKKGSISANHAHKGEEILFLIEGEIELTIGNETKKIKAPVRIDIPSKSYHKLLALTDIKLLINWYEETEDRLLNYNDN